MEDLGELPLKNRPDLYKYENDLIKRGYHLIAGCDEAGRGPLAGPVFAAAVILNPNDPIEGLFDSKQLTEKEREFLYNEIKKRAIAYQVVAISNEEIDKINILEASRKGMDEAILKLSVKPDYILTDYMRLNNKEIPFLPLTHGDALSATIGAASIMAKVERDRFMNEMDELYPGYGFKDNKGYPTKEHERAIERLGLTPIHRRSYAPVKKFIDKQLHFNI